MEIVIAHLTRMQPGFICAAGFDTATGKNVRPCLSNGRRLERDLFRRQLFDIGNIINLGPTKYAGQAPEFEDHIFSQPLAKFIRREEPGEFWNRLFDASETSLAQIFGRGLVIEKPRATVAENHGEASLGCLLPVRKPKLLVENLYGSPAVRIRLWEGGAFLNLSVTDLRLYAPDQKTIRTSQIEDISRRIQRGVPVILAVGLTRLFQKDPKSEPRHYLQVNNIHMEDAPLWTTGIPVL